MDAACRFPLHMAIVAAAGNESLLHPGMFDEGGKTSDQPQDWLVRLCLGEEAFDLSSAIA